MARPFVAAAGFILQLRVAVPIFTVPGVRAGLQQPGVDVPEHRQRGQDDDEQVEDRWQVGFPEIGRALQARHYRRGALCEDLVGVVEAALPRQAHHQADHLDDVLALHLDVPLRLVQEVDDLVQEEDGGEGDEAAHHGNQGAVQHHVLTLQEEHRGGDAEQQRPAGEVADVDHQELQHVQEHAGAAKVKKVKHTHFR